MRTYLVLLGLTLYTTGLFAQRINSQFKFKDGVYSSHQQLKENSPKHPLYEIPNFDYKIDGKENLLFLADNALAALPKSPIQSLDSIKILCIKGIPYLKTQPKNNAKEVYFVRYFLIGKICYFYYPIFKKKEIEMLVYNPYTGKPIAKKTIVNEERDFVKQIMHFESGEIEDYKLSVLKEWTADDIGLAKTLANMNEETAEEKLFKTLQIYNDRNPIYIKKD